MQAKIDCQKLYVSKLYLSKLYFPNCFLAVPRQTDRLLLKNTTKEHSERLVTLETCHQSDEEI